MVTIDLEKKQLTSDKSDVNNWYIAKLLGEIGFVIALPLIIFLLVGIWLDKLVGSKIIFTLIGMAVALVISGYAIYQKVKAVNEYNERKYKK